MPHKCKDSGVFTVLCVIGNYNFEDVMLDLGASINVMPKFVFQLLGIGPLQPMRVVIQLANRSFAYPIGVIKDVLVKVKELIFSTNFYILDMEGDSSSTKTLPILGRPFLKTARTKIDVYARTLSIEFGYMMVQFNLLDAMKYPVEDYFFLGINVSNELDCGVNDDLFFDFAALFDCFDSLCCGLMMMMMHVKLLIKL